MGPDVCLCLENFQTLRKLSRLAENFPDCPETFQTIWKLFRRSVNFPDYPETFQTVRKLSRLSGKLYDRQCQCADDVFGPLTDLRIFFIKFCRDGRLRTF